MADPISSYRSACLNADLMIGSSPAQVRGSAALDLVRTTSDGLRHGNMDARTARTALTEGQRAMAAGDLPGDVRTRLAPALSELESRLEALEGAAGRRADHLAPAGATTRPGHSQRTSPQQSLEAGLSPALGRVEDGLLASEVQHSLFRDRAQTTRTLATLATMSPSALRDTVAARVGAPNADRVVQAIGANTAMQVRWRAAERASRSLDQAASACERRASGPALEAYVDTLRGAGREAPFTQLRALGADPDDLRALLSRQSEPDARAELTALVSSTLRDGATQLRDQRDYFNPAHAVLDRHGEVYARFPESVRQVGAQLGVRGDLSADSEATRSALGALVHADVEAARQTARTDERVQKAAFLLAAVCTPIGIGSVIAGGVSAALREAAVVGVSYERARETELSAAAGETSIEAADEARHEFESERRAAVVSVAAEVVVGGALHTRELRHAAHLASGLSGAAAPTLAQAIVRGTPEATLAAHGLMEWGAGQASAAIATGTARALEPRDTERR